MAPARSVRLRSSTPRGPIALSNRGRDRQTQRALRQIYRSGHHPRARIALTPFSGKASHIALGASELANSGPGETGSAPGPFQRTRATAAGEHVMSCGRRRSPSRQQGQLARRRPPLSTLGNAPGLIGSEPPTPRTERRPGTRHRCTAAASDLERQRRKFIVVQRPRGRAA